MGQAYPELSEKVEQLETILEKEEVRFSETLDKGMAILLEEIGKTNGTILDGTTVFKLYDTYGFPMDLTADVAREHKMSIDHAQFEKDMQAQRELARASSQFKHIEENTIDTTVKTRFTGYTQTQGESSIVALYHSDTCIDTLKQGEQGVLVAESTPFYAESGGQVGDTGTIKTSTGTFGVTDTHKQADTWIHIGQVTEGKINTSQMGLFSIDEQRRGNITLNHSATHLMHSALREVLGDHVQQKGSLVNDDKFRFDFSHFEPLSDTQIKEVEKIVNQQIRTSQDTQTNEMTMDEAIESGALALFGEKYGDKVRVVNIGFSTELCGGTHIDRVGNIGVFKIVSESGVAAGVRRIEAITGSYALTYLSDQSSTISQLASLLNTTDAAVAEKVTTVLKESRSHEKEISRLKSKLAAKAGGDIASQAVDVSGLSVCSDSS